METGADDAEVRAAFDGLMHFTSSQEAGKRGASGDQPETNWWCVQSRGSFKKFREGMGLSDLKKVIRKFTFAGSEHKPTEKQKKGAIFCCFHLLWPPKHGIGARASHRDA